MVDGSASSANVGSVMPLLAEPLDAVGQRRSVDDTVGQAELVLESVCESVSAAVMV